MTDRDIVDLYWQRSESAIPETERAYGAYCHSVAFGLLRSAEDSEECLNDTWLAAWNAILPARVEGIRTLFYLRAEDEPLLQEVLADRADRKPRLEFLAPLDPLLWDKALIAALWDFRYSWEIYTPADRRKFGSYTLPMLWGERFIGRIEAVADRKSSTLLVKNIWLEPGVRLTNTVRTAIDRALLRLARFNACTRAERQV